MLALFLILASLLSNLSALLVLPLALASSAFTETLCALESFLSAEAFFLICLLVGLIAALVLTFFLVFTATLFLADWVASCFLVTLEVGSTVLLVLTLLEIFTVLPFPLASHPLPAFLDAFWRLASLI